MRKHRNARTHRSTRYARRPDGHANRALFRSMSPLQRVLDIRRVAALHASIAAALIPGYVPPEQR